MKKKHLIGIVALILVVSMLPVLMFLSWLVKPKKELKVAIVDKTVLTAQGNEHESFNWILMHEKYCKPNRDLYSISEDYYGFFPKDKWQYLVKDFQKYDDSALNDFADRTDMIYFTDTYGIFNKDWFSNNARGEYSKLMYGGMTLNDLKLLDLMKQKHKLILTEFNDIATPTSRSVRSMFEDMFGVQWTGWTGRYFFSLDTTVNKEIPVWVTRDYKYQHNHQWPFKKSGIVLVNDKGKVEILEYKKDLTEEVPYIISNDLNQSRFQIPRKIKYSYWFDVMLTRQTNNVVSVYRIFANARGDSILKSINIPNPFPAVIEHYDNDYKFYYFCGDFCDNPIDSFLAKFEGITKFSWFMYPSSDVSERKSFFWLYYEPLVSNILRNFYNALPEK